MDNTSVISTGNEESFWIDLFFSVHLHVHFIHVASSGAVKYFLKYLLVSFTIEKKTPKNDSRTSTSYLLHGSIILFPLFG